MPKLRISQSAVREQAQGQQAHRAIGISGIRLQRLSGHAAFVRAESHDVFQLSARDAARQFVQGRPGRKARAQQFDCIEQGASQCQSGLFHLGHQLVQIFRHQCGQFGRLVAAQGQASRVLARREF
jgi:hypothetical protein